MKVWRPGLVCLSGEIFRKGEGVMRGLAVWFRGRGYVDSDGLVPG